MESQAAPSPSLESRPPQRRETRRRVGSGVLLLACCPLFPTIPCVALELLRGTSLLKRLVALPCADFRRIRARRVLSRFSSLPSSKVRFMPMLRPVRTPAFLSSRTLAFGALALVG